MDSLEEEKHEDNLEEDIGIINNWEAGIYTHKKYLISDEFHVLAINLKVKETSSW